ncbi:hypothetical protein L226DRAFT_571941 [Lentinus tigrinus ALCF2SS1-7]|uniref:uncharacterized protein n=1 Tax=Lentinus tigrinus ALCF2SS1-7 TaxID=1328758 RepID=UPI001165ECE5|nr:hypothetical protein L226DRAFT_571941 [Lentinus tigrinus ALCF2SS1-7]
MPADGGRTVQMEDLRSTIDDPRWLEQHPTHRLPPFGFLPFGLLLMGKKVESMELARQDIKETNDALKHARRTLARDVANSSNLPEPQTNPPHPLVPALARQAPQHPIVAVERVRREILRIVADARCSGVNGGGEEDGDEADDAVSSVVIDFYLWDLAKRVEGRPDGVEGIQSAGMLPIHRTRSI